jgi:glycosyltransferase involved in cell wall biosynthesis
MNTERLQIAFLTSMDARNKKAWSGISYYMAKALEKHCGNIHYLGPVKPDLELYIGRIISLLTQKIIGKRYDYTHSIRLAKSYGRYFTKKLKKGNYDLIIVPATSSIISFLNTNLPIIYISDATFMNMINYYPFYTNLVKASVAQGMRIERAAIAKSRLYICPSAWAAASAIKDFGANPGKVHIIPFGANIDEVPSRDEVLSRKKERTCRLLFLGVEWERKGGAIAFDTFNELINRGINAELVICGCKPPKDFKHSKIKVIPFLDKNKKKSYHEFYNLLIESDFLIMPSRHECFGIVFCEAAAFGLPSIATDTGGVSGAIRNCENGYLLPLSSIGKQYAELIEELFKDEEKYLAMVKKSRELYETLFNWDVWAQEVSVLINSLQ